MGDTVAAQLVADQTNRFPTLALQQSPKESPGRTSVPTALYEDVNHVPVLIHRAPEIPALTGDRHENFVQEPRISKSPLPPLQPSRVVGAELLAPLPHGFVRHDDASFGQQVLDIAEAQAVAVVEPDRVTDDFRRKAMPQVVGTTSCHPCSPDTPSLGMPRGSSTLVPW